MISLLKKVYIMSSCFLLYHRKMTTINHYKIMFVQPTESNTDKRSRLSAIVGIKNKHWDTW